MVFFDFDAICFDLNEHNQHREYRIVQVDHEDILCEARMLVFFVIIAPTID